MRAPNNKIGERSGGETPRPLELIYKGVAREETSANRKTVSKRSSLPFGLANSICQRGLSFPV